jgi:hypothetical protein
MESYKYVVFTQCPVPIIQMAKAWVFGKMEVLNPYKTLTTKLKIYKAYVNFAILPNQTIDIRWNTDSEEIVMGNRTLTLIKVQ